MPKRMAELQPVGVNLDLPRHRVPPELWTGASNVNMREGIPTRIAGDSEPFPGFSRDRVLWLFPVLTTVAAFWIYAEESAGAGSNPLIKVLDGSNPFDISPVGGTTAGGRRNAFTSALLNGAPCLNWQTEAPAFWDLNTSNAVQTLTGWEANARCNALRPFKNYLIALDYTDGGGNRIPELVRWSGSAEPGAIPATWVPGADNDAGFISAAETPGACIDGGQLRDVFLIFKNDSTYQLSLVGGNDVFALRRLFDTAGVLSRNCTAEFYGQRVMFGDGDITVTDGANIQSIADRRIRRWIYSQISADEFERSYVAHYPAAKEIWFCFPGADTEAPNLAAIYDYSGGAPTWHTRPLDQAEFGTAGIVALAAPPEPWDDDSASWDSDSDPWDGQEISQTEDQLLLTGATSGFLEIDNPSATNKPQIDAELLRESLDFGKPHLWKMVRAIWPRFQAVAGTRIWCAVGTQDNPEDAITWHEAVFTVGTDRRLVIPARGRFLSFRFRTTGTQGWSLPGFGVEFGDGGGYQA